MLPVKLVGTVQDSKAKRQERLKSRFRDRGGIFVPAEGNTLAQLLLARGVNGESPSKRRSPRKSTAARTTTPKSVRSAKVVTKTPRAASKRARKSIVVPDANPADENTLPQPRIAPASTKKNKRRSTSKLKTPKSRGQRSRPHTKDVDLDDDDGVGDADAAPPLGSAGPSRPHASVRPKPFADQLADALNSAADQRPPDLFSTSVEPSRQAPSPPPLQGTSEEVIGKGKAAGTRSASNVKSPFVEGRQRENQDARRRTVRSTAVDLGRKTPQPPSPSPGGGRVAQCEAWEGDDDSCDDSDLPLAQKLTKIAPADTRPRSGKRTGAKDARPPPARKKRTASKAKADTKRTAVAADDADGDEGTKRTAKSVITRAQTVGATAAKGDSEATAGREAPANSRKRGAEEWRGHEETASPVVPPPPRGGEDAPDVVLPPTKRVRVLQEKSAPRKRKERMKNVDDGKDASTGAIRSAKNENENGPPTKKRRGADPQSAVSRRRRGKENENGMEPGKSARQGSRGVKDKPVLSPTGAHRKSTSKGKLPSRPGGTRARSRGLPPDVLRRIKVNAQTLAGSQDIDDDDPIDFLRS